VLVLNGDIFDFRWSTIGTQSTTVSAAMNWLIGLVGDFPGCHIHFVVGNHDCTVAFKNGLAELAETLPRFQWHEQLLRLGPLLFIHGDCAHRRMDKAGLLRFRRNWERDWRWSPAMAVAYECVDRLGITKRVHEFHFPRQQTVERLAFYLDSLCPGWRETTRACYFGHTHLPFADYEHDGVRFHNTGSAIHNMEFNPLCFEMLNGSDCSKSGGISQTP
jgi:UDP-2,3-diacylglucosamine hydrolase